MANFKLWRLITVINGKMKTFRRKLSVKHSSLKHLLEMNSSLWFSIVCWEGRRQDFRD